LLAGKHPNKVKVACAREMVGFVWESLNKVAAWKKPEIRFEQKPICQLLESTD
jgi:hypothetical protein